MQKKLVVLGFVLVIVIVLAFLLIRPAAVEFGENPEDWVKADGELRRIDIAEATGLNGFFDESGVQLRYPDLTTALGLEGSYKGARFAREYRAEEGSLLMRITPDMTPNDGVIEGFILERKEGTKLVAYLFVDEDWKKLVRPTNIAWGRSFGSERAAEFQEISPGIHLDKVEEDLGRFSDNFLGHSGGIVVGDMSRESTQGRTFIKII